MPQKTEEKFNTKTKKAATKMENSLIRLLDSQHLDEVTSELCDFTIEEQNQFAESQGIKPSASSDHQPILGISNRYNC